jgi:hypothetical protein
VTKLVISNTLERPKRTNKNYSPEEIKCRLNREMLATVQFKICRLSLKSKNLKIKISNTVIIRAFLVAMKFILSPKGITQIEKV